MKNDSNAFGITSLVLGILSIVSFFVGSVFGILGIIFAVKQRKKHSNGIATAGLITSIIGTVIWSWALLLFLWAVLIGLGSAV